MTFRRRTLLSLLRAASLFLLVGAVLGAAPSASAQTPVLPWSGDAAAEPAGIPEDLTPETVDALMARLTDAEIRGILREELRDRAAEQAAAAAAPTGIAALAADFQAMRARIQANAARIWRALGRLGDRQDRVAELLGTASHGVMGMIGAAALLVAAGGAAVWAGLRMTFRWREWLMDTAGDSYWERVVRTFALTAVGLLPIAAFWLTVGALAPLLSGPLGPMVRDGFSYVWIFQAGVANVWIAILLSRRVLAPYAPQLRIANANDLAAEHIYHLIRTCALISMGGWLIAGLWPMLGYGFAPAMATLIVASTIVLGVLVHDAATGFAGMSAATARLFGAGAPLGVAPGGPSSTTLGLIVATAAPWIVVSYVIFAYLYWLAMLLATGQQHLVGPVGAFLVGLALPAFDRLGDELARSMLRRAEREAADRFHRVLHGAWRVFLGLAAATVVAALWGFELLALAKGEDAPRWASAVFDIAVTLMIGQLIWRLIKAALHREKRMSTGDMEDQVEEGAGSSRLETLVPLLRNFLLMVLAIIVMMIVLSSLGVDIGPLLASAGIIGIAIGFGAQTLVRDIFSGVFFLIDDAFRVGEYIELEGDLRGEVEGLSIRSLQLRHHRGAIVTIPFGELKNVTNHSRDWVIYKMSFRLEPDTDPAKVKKIVKRVGFDLLEDPEHGPKFFEPVKSQGVFMIDDDSALVIRVKFKAKPRTQFVLRREVYHRLRAAFAENDVRFARRKVEVVASSPEAAAAAAEGDTQKPSTLAATADAL